MTEEIFIAAFRNVVEQHGSNIALAESGRPIYTYRELQNRAQAIGAALQQKGVGRESAVGLYLEKSAHYVAALLGVWFAGGAFVPLDPGLPSGRLRYMCAQADVQVVLHDDLNTMSGDKVTAKLASLPDKFQTPELMSLSSIATDQGNTLKPPLITPETLAYVIFTSGSTGRPKGVLVEHRGIASFIRAQIEAFQLGSESQSLWYLSSNFDASVSDLGTALLSGATLHIEPSVSLQPGAGLEAVLAERGITYMDIPPAVLRVMDPAKLPASVSTIVIGGEACAPEAVRAFSAKVRLLNVYGPTESTVCTSLGLCHGDWDRALIGQPLPNISYHLLDEQLNEVDTGVPAQLYIGGIGLARGYAKREDLTAAKFIRHNNERLYRTGDLVVKCEDGEFQFLGRTDRQIKLRGMLVEPEEIEARLMQHPDVQRAAVLKRAVKADLAREQLVAFIQARPGAAIDGNVLRLHLSQTLPLWMIPQRFEFSESLPLTVTGKVDLSSLKAARLAQVRLTTNLPADPICRLLTEVWASVLDVDYPGLGDDFFDIGGDSFAVVEVVVAAEARGLSVPPALMLAHPTIGALAQALSAKNFELSDGGGMTAAQLRADLTFQPELQSLVEQAISRSRSRSSFQTAASKPANILLTGATGFLGARLLHNLCQESAAQIYCLVRAENEAQARARIDSALAVHGLDGSDLTARIIPVCGDVGQSNFGLREDLWLTLAQSIDTIFHSAAQVNMLLPYRDLRSSNVAGTMEVVRFMLTGHFPKVLHYASTLSVFVATDKNHGLLSESNGLEDTGLVFGGYAQSKWASEVLLRELGGAAGPVSYHRFGLITGDSVSGFASTHDFLELFVRGIDSLGCIPQVNQALSIDITPIDYAAAAYCRLALKAMAENNYETYHIANNRTLTLEGLLQNMRALGRSIALVDAHQFKQRLLEKGSTLTAAESAACLALCRSFSTEGFDLFRTMDLFQATDVVFDQTNTMRGLRGSDIECPPPSDSLIQLYLRRMLNLPVPAQKA